MSSRKSPGVPKRSFKRAKTPEKKEELRSALLAVGRRMLEESPDSEPSLRKIALALHLTPSAVYKYFRDQEDLFAAILEDELAGAIDTVDRISAAHADPRQRIKAAFTGVVAYWLANPRHFDVLFTKSRPLTEGQPPQKPIGMIARSYDQYRGLVRDYFDALPAQPIRLELATDALIAATHGAILLVRRTRQISWSPLEEVTEELVEGVLQRWEGIARDAHSKRTATKVAAKKKIRAVAGSRRRGNG